MSNLKKEWDDSILMKTLKMLKRNYKVLLITIGAVGVVALILQYILEA